MLTMSSLGLDEEARWSRCSDHSAGEVPSLPARGTGRVRHPQIPFKTQVHVDSSPSQIPLWAQVDSIVRLRFHSKQM